jgi:hypothetical protein
MPAIIAALVSALRIMFMAKMGLMAVKLLAFLGLQFVTHKYAIGPLLSQLTAYATAAGSAGGDFGANLVAWMGVLNFDRAISMVISAYSTRATIMQAKTFLGLSAST